MWEIVLSCRKLIAWLDFNITFKCCSCDTLSIFRHLFIIITEQFANIAIVNRINCYIFNNINALHLLHLICLNVVVGQCVKECLLDYFLIGFVEMWFEYCRRYLWVCNGVEHWVDLPRGIKIWYIYRVYIRHCVHVQRRVQVRGEQLHLKQNKVNVNNVYI